MNTRSVTFCFAVLLLGALKSSADLGDSPEQVASRMKGGLIDVKQGVGHIIEVAFGVNGNFALFTFLDGRVCREFHLLKHDAPQEDRITRLLTDAEETGHKWNILHTTSGNRRWRRDDGKIDIVYGSMDKPPVKHALTITAAEYPEYLERIISSNGGDVPGEAPTVAEIKSRIESRLHYVSAVQRVTTVDNESASYKFGSALGRYGLSLAVVGLVIRAWTRRVSRRTVADSARSRAQYYRLLLLKMSWRVAVIFLASMFLVLLSQVSPGISTEQASEAEAVAFVLLLLFCPPAMLVTSWTQTKRKFVQLSESAAPDPHD